MSDKDNNKKEDLKDRVTKGKYKLDRQYLQNILDSVDIPDSNLTPMTHGEKLMIAVLIQQNLLLARLTDLLMIATGLTTYTDEKPSSDISGVDSDIRSATADKDDVIAEKMGKSMVCGQCGNGVVPNPMGYCPRCHKDLKTQVAQELLNKKQ